MSRHATAPRLGVSRQIPLKLPPDVAVDLHAFCEVHFKAAQTTVICTALRQFLERELAADEVVRQRFELVKSKLLSQATKELRVVRHPKAGPNQQPDGLTTHEER